MPVILDIDRVIAGIFHAFLNLSALTSHLFGALHPQRRSPSFMTNVYAPCICINNCREVKLAFHSFDIQAHAAETNLRGLYTCALHAPPKKSFYHSDFRCIVRRAAGWNGRFTLHGAQKRRHQSADSLHSTILTLNHNLRLPSVRPLIPRTRLKPACTITP